MLSTTHSQQRLLTHGRGTEGQIGNQKKEDSYGIIQEVTHVSTGEKKEPISNINIKFISSCCKWYTHFIDDKGRVFSWGWHPEFSQGLDISTYPGAVTIPTLVEELSQYFIVDVASGEKHTLFLTSTGEVLIAYHHAKMIIPLTVTLEKGDEVARVFCGMHKFFVLSAKGLVYSAPIDYYSDLKPLQQVSIPNNAPIEDIKGSYLITFLSKTGQAFLQLQNSDAVYPVELPERAISVAAGSERSAYFVTTLGKVFVSRNPAIPLVPPTQIVNDESGEPLPPIDLVRAGFNNAFFYSSSTKQIFTTGKYNYNAATQFGLKNEESCKEFTDKFTDFGFESVNVKILQAVAGCDTDYFLIGVPAEGKLMTGLFKNLQKSKYTDIAMTFK